MASLSWEQIEKASGDVANKIAASGFAPQHIVGVALGGCVPLALIAKYLEMKDVSTISARSYTGDKQQSSMQITATPTIDLSGKRILLVDEIADSGTTLHTLAELLRTQYRVSEVKTAVLAVNTKNCVERPDYWAVESDEWIVFPWDEI